MRLLDSSVSQDKFKASVAYPQIYSLEKDEWSVIEWKEDKLGQEKIAVFPSIFNIESRNMLIVFGGQPFDGDYSRIKEKYKPVFQIWIEERRQKIESMKIHSRQGLLPSRYKIMNPTIRFLREESRCLFFKRSMLEQSPY